MKNMPDNRQHCVACPAPYSTYRARLYRQNGTGRQLWLCGFHHNLLEALGWELFKERCMLKDTIKMG